MSKLQKNYTLKTLLLTLLMFFSLNSFSQKDTIKIKIDSTTVKIQKEVALSIAKELVQKDALVKENILLKEDTSILRNEINQYKRDSVLFYNKELVFKSIQNDNEKIKQNYQLATDKLNKQLKISKAKTTSAELILLASVIYIIFNK